MSPPGPSAMRFDQVEADNPALSTERVPCCCRCQASLWATLAGMPLNESRRDLSPECDEAESSSVRETRVPVVLLWTGHRIDLDSDRRGRRTECETRRSAQIGLSSTPFCPPLRWRENPGRDCAASSTRPEPCSERIKSFLWMLPPDPDTESVCRTIGELGAKQACRKQNDSRVC